MLMYSELHLKQCKSICIVMRLNRKKSSWERNDAANALPIQKCIEEPKTAGSNDEGRVSAPLVRKKATHILRFTIMAHS